MQIKNKCVYLHFIIIIFFKLAPIVHLLVYDDILSKMLCSSICPEKFSLVLLQLLTHSVALLECISG